MTDAAKGQSHRRAVALGFLLLSLIAVLPIASVHLPPILDYPNHLARMHILAALPGSADLAHYYRAVWTPIPDLAFDAVVPALADGRAGRDRHADRPCRDAAGLGRRLPDAAPGRLPALVDLAALRLSAAL